MIFWKDKNLIKIKGKCNIFYFALYKEINILLGNNIKTNRNQERVYKQILPFCHIVLVYTNISDLKFLRPTHQKAKQKIPMILHVYKRSLKISILLGFILYIVMQHVAILTKEPSRIFLLLVLHSITVLLKSIIYGLFSSLQDVLFFV